MIQRMHAVCFSPDPFLTVFPFAVLCMLSALVLACAETRLKRQFKTRSWRC
jgi:hypothetical protein